MWASTRVYVPSEQLKRKPNIPREQLAGESSVTHDFTTVEPVHEVWEIGEIATKKEIIFLLPNLHKILSPFYFILCILGAILIQDFRIIETPLGFYRFLGDLGPFLTALVATLYVWKTFRRK